MRICKAALAVAAALLLVLLPPAVPATRLVDGGGALRPATPQPPQLPDSYSVNYTFTLPYTAQVQQAAISYPVAFYRDARSHRVRMDTFDAANSLIAKGGMTFELVPRIVRQVCLVFKEDSGDESLQSMASLPDVRGWQYGGVEELGGEEAHLWQYEARHEAKHVLYRYYVSSGGTPRRFHMLGNDLFSGAHFDEWVADYTGFQAGRPDPAVFQTPELCRNEQPRAVKGRTASQLRMAALVPAAAYRGDAEYDAFLASHGAGRRHRSLQDYTERRQLFTHNLALILEHNAAADTSYKLAMNRFGDYSHDEFVTLMLPKTARRRQQQQQQQLGEEQQQQGSDAAGASSVGRQQGASQTATAEAEAAAAAQPRSMHKHELPYQPLADPALLPATVSWRGTGGDSTGVKDQAACGSCWTFAAAGAMEAAWWQATGNRVSFSEQQIVDCSWGFVEGSEASNMACDGGDPWAGIGHIVESGGIAETAAYQYKGQDGYCLANTTQRVGKFKGYARLPLYHDAAVMEALYSRGPIAISFDASQPWFRFYSSGVVFDPHCAWKADELDHSMLLVGYGTNAAGDYWEVKNSWSTHWGDGGYFKISRDSHACGVASDAVYAVVVTDGL